MKQEIIADLSRITEEEQAILDGSGKGAVFERAEVCDGCGKAAGAGKID